jgi:hypothetical protein
VVGVAVQVAAGVTVEMGVAVMAVAAAGERIDETTMAASPPITARSSAARMRRMVFCDRVSELMIAFFLAPRQGEPRR